MAIRETDWLDPSELEILVRCQRLVKEMLSEEKRVLDYMERNGGKTIHSKIRIARLEYALGLRERFPNIKAMLKGEDT